MDANTKILFDKLALDRADSAKIFSKPSMRGVQHSVVEKYSDQAHFIYELIQNADDARATQVTFELYDTELVFRHNGTRHFSLTDVETEEKDTIDGTLGDLNAITSIANSNKDKASIGKFGVGFKAVFQYTNTPHIYDKYFRFKIVDFFVPVLLDDDYPGRDDNETIFVFPFNHRDRDADEAYTDIREKITHLLFPTLFLQNLQMVSYTIGENNGFYKQNIIESRKFDDTTAELISLSNGHSSPENLWLFSRLDSMGHKYSTGFFLNDDGKLEPVSYAAFCYFPTKEVTNLNFIINGAFLLTDSREGIMAANAHNVGLVKCLAELAADSLGYLTNIGNESGIQFIDDSVLNIIPFNKKKFSPEGDKSKISFMPFFICLREKLKSGLVPARNCHTDVDHAFWADTMTLAELFSDEQLSELIYEEDEEEDTGLAHFVFVSLGRNATNHNAEDGFVEYIDDLVTDWYGEDDIFDFISADFIGNQSWDWLYKFYEFIAETNKRIQKIKAVPIFITENGKVTSAYSKSSSTIPNIYIPQNGVSGYDFPHENILNNEFARKILSELGIKTPEYKDMIYNKLFKKSSLGAKSDFKAFIGYYKELINSDDGDASEFCKDLSSKAFIKAKSRDGLSSSIDFPMKLYFPSDDLEYYFLTSGDTMFVDIEYYESFLTKGEQRNLHQFLLDLGVSEYPRIMRKVYSGKTMEGRYKIKWSKSTGNQTWFEFYLDGATLAVKRIEADNDKRLSELLWKYCVFRCNPNTVGYNSVIFRGEYHYFYRTQQMDRYSTWDVATIETTRWIFDRAGNLCVAGALSIQRLNPMYDTTSPKAARWINMLGIGNEHPEYDDLDDGTRKKVEMADLMESLGLVDITPEEIALLVKNRERESTQTNELPTETYEDDKDKEEPPELKYVEKVAERIKKRKVEANESSTVINEPEPSNTPDADEYSKATVDYKKITEEKTKAFEAEAKRLELLDEAQERAMNAEKYSFEWFCALLELEYDSASEDTLHNREVSITFDQIEREAGTAKTVILRHPSCNIPSVIEELTDIPMIVTFKNGQSKSLTIDGANVQSYTLRVKLKDSSDLDGIDLGEVSEISIKAKNPSFLLSELKNSFKELKVCASGTRQTPSPDFNMQLNLCENIEFVFGPPGTGKTTYVANKIIRPLVEKNENVRILVLTPTNKAADVITTKIMEQMGSDHSYENWLIRYGTTADERIEDSPVLRGRELDIESFQKCVITTTIARFPYDYFIGSDGKFRYLKGINWDYIVFDEASMIPLFQIIYPLYLKTPQRFYIAGDPFQIEPVVSVDLWKAENIYTMIHLNSFTSIATVPHDYHVELLKMQYRSTPAIGTVFSKLTYGDSLTHYRTDGSRKPLNIESYLDYDSLNIIKFPVSKYESIYRSKKLASSNYHIYSALFTYEFVNYIARALVKENPKSNFNIGIISPYGAQASIIDKLLSSADISKNIHIVSSTIHSFQGDECDIVIALFNPPPFISSGDRIFLNHQSKINVAISRARDYLFVLMPDDNTDNVSNLYLIKKLEKIMRADPSCVLSEMHTLEAKILGTADYLESHSFTTGHQPVNVYGLPEKEYEIRSEEKAIDIQIHNIKRSKSGTKNATAIF